MDLERIFEVNVVPFLHQLHISSVEEIPDDILNAWRWKWEFDAIYLMGVWERSRIPLTNKTPGFEHLFHSSVPWKLSDISTSPFSIYSYAPAGECGGVEALDSFRKRLNIRGMKLILDFVPNHTAPDHPWVHDHPDWYVRDFLGEIMCGASKSSERWADTRQLDYSHPDMRSAMLQGLNQISSHCDGVRCDMAHLALSSRFDATWEDFQTYGKASDLPEFWEEVRHRLGSKFLLLAEVYEGREYDLLQCGFDLTYDKECFLDRLKGELVNGDNSDVIGHIRGCNQTQIREKTYGERLVRFLENHDEERAASVFSHRLQPALEIWKEQFGEVHGPLFFHNGQLSGARRRTPVMLKKFLSESVDEYVLKMYEELFSCGSNWRRKVPCAFEVESESTTSLWPAGR